MSAHHNGAADHQPAPRRGGSAVFAIVLILLGLTAAIAIIMYWGPAGLTTK